MLIYTEHFSQLMSLRALIEFQEVFKCSPGNVPKQEWKRRKTHFGEAKLHVASSEGILCFPVESCGTNFENIRFPAIVFSFAEICSNGKSTAHFKDDQFLSFPKLELQTCEETFHDFD